MRRLSFVVVMIIQVVILQSVVASSAAVSSDINSMQFRPLGWVEEFLNRQVSGLTGHPEESGFPFDRGGWIGGLDYTEREIKGGKSWFPYEQAAYYLDGALRCGYLANNAEMKRVARENIDHVIASADSEGRIRLLDIEDDWWPLVVFFRIMTEEYEVTRDERILNALVRHYRATYSDPNSVVFNFQGFSSRSLLHVEHLCVLYGFTGERWFVEMAETLYNKFEGDRKKPISITAKGMNADMSPSGHAVTYHEFLKLPAVLYYYTGKEHYRTAFEKGIMMLERDHELADGLSSAVEFTSGKSSAQAHELCNTIDYNWSVGWALLATENAYYADKIEKSFYNSGLSAVTPDFRAHQYYAAPNMAISSSMSSAYNDKTNWGMHGKKRLCYRPGHDTECCSGNVHRLLPTFINRSTMVNDRGVKVNFYLPSRTRVAYRGEDFEFTQETGYPFEFSSKFTIERAPSSKLNFGLRIPHWATSYSISYNGSVVESGKNSEACYRSIDRKFKQGDVVEVSFESAPRFEATAQGVAVNYGSLVYSMAVECTVHKITDDGAGKCSEAFPAYEIFPKEPLGWAYGVLTAEGIEVAQQPSDEYVWERGAAPVKLRVKAKAVKNWRLKEWTYTDEYPEKVETEDDVVTLTLEPIGGTILRITDFPKLD
ncbi:MAG: beta-L-arabinofuranosidase domain-containing protein [Rikenellaceae bacterium]